MGTLFKQPSELATTSTLKVLVYGQPGLGKSTLALSAPKPVLFDFDGGVQRVAKAFQCPTLQVESWEQAIQALDEVESGEVDCRTIVIDTVGKMLDYMADYIMRNDSKMKMRDGSLQLKGYGVLKTMFVNLLKRISMMGKNLVFVAHEREDKDGDTRIVRPDMIGSNLGSLLKELDLVGYMQAAGTERSIWWSPQEKFYAKNTCNLPQWQKIPTIIAADGTPAGRNDFLTTIFAAYNAYLAKQAEVSKNYADLLAQIEDDIAAVADAKTATECITKICGYAHIWDSKARASVLLKAKTDELGLKYNKASKCYEAA